MSAATEKRSAQSTIMRFVVLFLILCVNDLHAKFTEITDSSELQTKIRSTDYVFVIFCKDKGSEECDAEKEEFSQYFVNGIPDFPDLAGVVAQVPDAEETYGIIDFPTVLFFRQGNPIILSADDLEDYDLPVWLQKHRDVHTTILTDANFEHDTQAASGATTGDWFIMFYDNTCPGSLASWEHVGLRFSHGQMYTYDDDVINVKQLVNFAKGGFKRKTAVPVAVEVEDCLLTKLSAAVKTSLKNPTVLGVSICAVGVLLLLLLVVIIAISKKKRQRAKFD